MPSAKKESSVTCQKFLLGKSQVVDTRILASSHVRCGILDIVHYKIWNVQL